MPRLVLLAALVLALAASWASSAAAAKKEPVTKQTGKTPVFKDFTSICAVPGYLDYGNCNGDPTTYGRVRGRIAAVQPKPGVWNLRIRFRHLEPGAKYRLWGNRSTPPVAGDNSGFFLIGTAFADVAGKVRFEYKTTQPANLGFDLNILADAWETNGVTVVTSYWSEQALQVRNPDGSLYVPTP
jgi:hypothetical protein